MNFFLLINKFADKIKVQQGVLGSEADEVRLPLDSAEAWYDSPKWEDNFIFKVLAIL